MDRNLCHTIDAIDGRNRQKSVLILIRILLVITTNETKVRLSADS